MLAQITAPFSARHINIESFANASKGDVAYTIVETNVPVTEEIEKELQNIQGVFGVRVFAGK